MRIASFLLTGILLLLGGIIGPTACHAPRLSQVTAQSVRVRSVVQKSSSSRGGGGRFIFSGGSSGRSSSSSRYSSGGGFSSGK
ncbi:MAG: hypothetical protein KC656_01510 [Myxococcales bacterium]|nr:hypothetical protein [Myxococcales bacterium]MCB9673155.1 hypothetical protein [Alphaproteobacteria bacterium]